MAEWFQSISEWFWPRFDPNKCKLYLKSAVVRMNLKKKKGQEQVKQMEKEIGDLAKQEKEDLARLRVEQLVRDKRMLEAYDMLELMCEIVVSRLQLINMYPAVPEDLVEPVYTLAWASLRLAIPEFKHLAFQFKLKYGDEWIQDALNNTSHYVNQELIERLSVCCTDQDTVEEEMCRISPVPAKSSSFELAAFDGDPGAASPSYLSAFSPAAGAGPAAPTWAYTTHPGGPSPVAAQQAPLGHAQSQLPAPYLGQPQQQQQQQYQQQPPQYVQYQQQPQQPTVHFPAPATASPALPPSAPSMLPPPQVSAAPAGSAPSPVLQPFVLPELDFGDWSSPLATTSAQGLAFPHMASTSTVLTSSPFPSSSSSSTTPTSSSSIPSSTATITTTSTTSAMAPTSTAPHEVDPSLMFPAIPSDNPDPAKTTSALPPPAGGDDGGAAPGGATEEEEFDELSARFEALKRGL